MTQRKDQLFVSAEDKREFKYFISDVWSSDGPDFMGCNCCPIGLALLEEQAWGELNKIAEIDVPVNEEGEDDCFKCYKRKVEQFKDHIRDRMCWEYGGEIMDAARDVIEEAISEFRG